MEKSFIGVISDTHGLLRPEALERLTGASHVLHAGDVGAPFILDALAGIAPLLAIRGNVDIDDWADALPETRTETIGGHRVHMLHDLKTLAIDPAAEGISVVISGHSHKPSVSWRDGVLYLNPGSAGRRRFSLPISVARLQLTPGRPPEAEILDLAA